MSTPVRFATSRLRLGCPMIETARTRPTQTFFPDPAENTDSHGTVGSENPGDPVSSHPFRGYQPEPGQHSSSLACRIGRLADGLKGLQCPLPTGVKIDQGQRIILTEVYTGLAQLFSRGIPGLRQPGIG